MSQQKARTHHELTVGLRDEQAAGDTKREAEWSINRKVNGPGFNAMWERYKADPVGYRDAFEAWMTMVNTYADVLRDQVAAKAA
jgi:hypothetical protein